MRLRSVIGVMGAAVLAAALAGCGATPGATGTGSSHTNSAVGTGQRALTKTGMSIRKATSGAKGTPAGKTVMHGMKKTKTSAKGVNKAAKGALGTPAKGGKGAMTGKGVNKAGLVNHTKGGQAGGRGGAAGKPKGAGGGKGAMAGKGSKGGKPGAPASAPTSITPAMAAQGATLFTAKECSSCHGPQGAGTGSAPALNGTGSVPVLTTYPTAEALATFIHQNMPLTSPGSLSATQADELAAYVYYTLNHHAKT